MACGRRGSGGGEGLGTREGESLLGFGWLTRVWCGGEEMETKRDGTRRARQRADGRAGERPETRRKPRIAGTTDDERSGGFRVGVGLGCDAALVCCVPRAVGGGTARVRAQAWIGWGRARDREILVLFFIFILFYFLS